MSCRHLRANTRLTLRHNGEGESHSKYAAISQTLREFRRHFGIAEHHGNDGMTCASELKAGRTHGVAKILGIGRQLPAQFRAFSRFGPDEQAAAETMMAALVHARAPVSVVWGVGSLESEKVMPSRKSPAFGGVPTKAIWLPVPAVGSIMA